MAAEAFFWRSAAARSLNSILSTSSRALRRLEAISRLLLYRLRGSPVALTGSDDIRLLTGVENVAEVRRHVARGRIETQINQQAAQGINSGRVKLRIERLAALEHQFAFFDFGPNDQRAGSF